MSNRNRTNPSSDATGDDEGANIYLATAGYDHTIRFWSPRDGKCSRVIQHPHSQVNDLRLSPDKNFLAAASFQHIRLYNLNTTHSSTPEVNLEGFTNNVLSIGFLQDSQWLYSGGEDCIARVWDLRTRKNQLQVMFQGQSAVNSVKLHSNQVDIYIGQQHGHINIWDIRSKNATPMVRIPQQHPSIYTGVQCLSLHPFEDILAAIDNTGQVHIFAPAKTLTLYRTWRAHSKYGLKCLFSPNGEYLVTTSADFTAKIWNTCDITNPSVTNNNNNNINANNNNDLQQDHNHGHHNQPESITPYKVLSNETQRWVWAAEFSADSQFLATTSSDGVVRLWHIETAEARREFTGHQKGVTALAFSE